MRGWRWIGGVAAVFVLAFGITSHGQPPRSLGSPIGDIRAGFKGGPISSAMCFLDDTPSQYGTGCPDASIEYDTAQTPDSMVIFVGTDSRVLLIKEAGDTADTSKSQTTDPNLCIHSSDDAVDTDLLCLEHNRTDGRIYTDGGDIILDPALNLSLGTSLVFQTDDTGNLRLYGGSVDDTGGNIHLYAGTHATAANDFYIRADTTNIIGYDDSVGDLTINPAASLNVTLTAADADSFDLNDGSTSYYIVDTQVAVDGTRAHTFDATDVSYAAAATSATSLVDLASYTVTLTGSTGVTTPMDGMSLRISSPVLTDASAVTVTQASTLYVAAPTASGSVTLTTGLAAELDGNVLIGGITTLGSVLNTSSNINLNTTGDITFDSTGQHFRGIVDDDPVTPTFECSPGEGMFCSTDGRVDFARNGLNVWRMSASGFVGVSSGNPALVSEVSSATNPTLIPYGGDFDTGVGGNNLDALSLIAGGIEALRITEAASAITTAVFTAADTSFSGTITAGNDIVSDTDSTDNLGSAAVRWAIGFFDTLGDAAQALSIAATQTDFAIGANAGTASVRQVVETLTFAADPGDASQVTSGLIPDGAFLIGVTTRNTTAGTNCTSVDIGDTTPTADVDLFAVTASISDSATTTNADNTAGFTNPLLDSDEVTVTANGGNCFDLVIRITASYILLTADTSD